MAPQRMEPTTAFTLGHWLGGRAALYCKGKVSCKASSSDPHHNSGATSGFLGPKKGLRTACGLSGSLKEVTLTAPPDVQSPSN